MNSPKNFKYLDELIHGQTNCIIIDSDIALSDGEESQYKDGIELEMDNITIDGNGHTIDAEGKARIFLVTGKKITIKNVTLKNGFSTENGGAIYTTGSLSIINSCLIKNTGDWGGAIRCEKGKIRITKSALKENTAKNGAAIYTKADALSIEKSHIISNTSLITGAAICSEKGEITIEDSEIKHNSANYFGGAISHSMGNFTIKNSQISHNTSPENIIFNNDFLEIQNTDLAENTARHVILNYGNAYSLAIFYGKIAENEITESVICHNAKSCTIEKTAFSENLKGQGQMNIKSSGDLILISPKINDPGKTILNERYVLIKQSAEIAEKICGKGKVEIEKDIIPQDERFDFGYLDEMIRKSDEIILNEDITFENYERDFYEGGIELDKDNITIDGRGKTIDARHLTRIFIISADNITLKNITFKNGSAHKNYANPPNSNGGAVKVNHVKGLKIENCVFTDGISDENGGAIDNWGELEMAGCTLKKNFAQRRGGAICNNGSLVMDSSALNENRGDNGGALYNFKGTLVIEKSEFTKNQAVGFGGAIYNCKGSLMIEKSAITQNSAQWLGSGSIYDYFEKSSIVVDCTFRDNAPDYFVREDYY